MKKLTNQWLIICAVLLVVGCYTSVSAQNPLPQVTEEYRRRNICSDPWVTMAVIRAYSTTREPHGRGNYGECDVSQYNNGQWNSYDELVRAVERARDDMQANGTSYESYRLPNNQFATVYLDPQGKATQGWILSHNGGTLQESDVTMVVAKMVAAGGMNLVAAGGGNIIPTGGGNFLAKIRSLIGTDGSSISQLISEGGSTVKMAKLQDLFVNKNVVADFALKAPEIVKAADFARGYRLQGVRKYYKVGSIYRVWR